MLSERSLRQTLWESIAGDRDLVFFGLSFLIWLSGYLSTSPKNVWVGILGSSFFLAGISFYFQKHRTLARQLTGTKHIPVVCVVGKPDSEAQRTFALAKEAISRVTGFRAFQVMERFFRIKLSLSHFEMPLPPEAAVWEEFIYRIQERIDCLANALYGPKVYHIFIQGPASLAIGLGAVFGWKHPVVAYQWAAGEYEPVLDLRERPRKPKEKLPVAEGYRFIKLPPDYLEGLTEDTVVVLGMAGHPPWGDVEHFIRNVRKVNWKIVTVENTYGGTLKQADWGRVAQELYSVFYDLHNDPRVRRIHLFHSMPGALAFGLGAALGTAVPVTVYNWEAKENTYYAVLELNKLKSRL